jgi:hypothetical protein
VYIAIDLAMAIIMYFHFPGTRRMTLEQISLMSDNSVKEGRKMVLEQMRAQEAERQANALREKVDDDDDKGGFAQHLERKD